MTIAIDILTTQRDKLLKKMESNVDTRNTFIKNIASLEEQMDKDIEKIVSISHAIEFLENNQ